MKKEQFKPLHDFVMIEVAAPEVKNAKIHIPTFAQEKPSIAKVLAVGPGIYDFKAGHLVVPPVSVGDNVIVVKTAIQEISIGYRQSITLIKAGDIIGKIED
jgi:chaperonin GroES